MVNEKASIYRSRDEPERLAALRALHILDTPHEERFDRITQLASELLNVPIAYVSFIDENRQWMKSCCGWNVLETPRNASIGIHTILQEEPLIIPDALADDRFRDHPMVTGDPHLRFYAGHPLTTADGHNIGTFSIADHRPRRLSARHVRRFKMLADMVVNELNLIGVIQLQVDAIHARAEAEAAQRERADALGKLVESQEHLAEELSKAASYVHSLLPKRLTGPLCTDWVFIPSTELGGDTFGYHWLDDDHFALYLLDVCGHGIGGALHSVSVLNVLRSQTLPNTDFYDPGDVLASLNDAFQMKAYNNMYFTIWYGVYNRRTRHLTYATGGHPPALLITHADEEPTITPLRTRGLLIGGVRDVAFPSATTAIPEGSSLYVFSDGAYEVRLEDDTMMGLDEFIDLLAETVSPDQCDVTRVVERLFEVGSCDTCMDDLALLRVTFG